MGAAGLVIALIVLVVAGTLSAWLVQKYGWDTVRARATVLPHYLAARARAAALRLNINLSNYQSLVDFDGRIRLAHYGFGRKRGGAGLEALRFVRFVDPVHQFSFVHPDGWSVARSEHPDASIIVQLTSEAGGDEDDSYKRFSVAWDDVSWSATTSESFGRGVAAQLPSLVPGSQLLSHGPYQVGAGGGLPVAMPPASDGTPGTGTGTGGAGAGTPPGDAYQLVHRISDPGDASVLQLLNVVFVSTHGGRRRAYTVTFGADADSYTDVLRLARLMIDSFRFHDAIDGVGAAAAAAAAAGGGGGAAGGRGAGPAASQASEDSEVHVNVWERSASSSSSTGYTAPTLPVTPHRPTSFYSLQSASQSRAPAAYPGTFLGETPSDPADVPWVSGSLPQAGLAYALPATWMVAHASPALGPGDGEPHPHPARLSPLSPLFSTNLLGLPGGLTTGTHHHQQQQPRAQQHGSSSSSSSLLPVVRRWSTFACCDRRESCFKGLSLVCIDLTPLVDLLALAQQPVFHHQQQQQPHQLGAQSSGLLLAYLHHRYTCEVADNEAVAQGLPPEEEEALKPWLDAFGMRWPRQCRLATPLPCTADGPSSSSSSTSGGALGLTGARMRGISGVSVGSGISTGSGGGGGHLVSSPDALLAAPYQTALLEVRGVASSRLLKVGGWLRSSSGLQHPPLSGGGPGDVSPASSRTSSLSHHHPLDSHWGSPGGASQRRFSAYSSASVDNAANDGLAAEGQLISTTSAVLLGVHEAVVPVSGHEHGVSPAGSSSTGAVFGHVVTFAAAADAFGRYEPLAKHLFQSLEAVVA